MTLLVTANPLLDDDQEVIPDRCVCASCGLRHRTVEAAGVYYCPNPICRMCGGGLVRHARTCEECITEDSEDGSSFLVTRPCREMKRLQIASEHFYSVLGAAGEGEA